MRTKALFVAAALGVAAITTSLAQVYSVNAVGYVNKTFGQVGGAAAFSLASNPLVAESNNLADLMPDAPPQTVVYTWDGAEFQLATQLPAGLGWNANPELTPGGGFFIRTGGGEFTVTFVGEVMQSVPPYVTTAGDPLMNDVPQGLSIKSSMVPQAGTLTELGWDDVAPQTVCYLWDFDNQEYSIRTALPAGLGWNGGEPALEVGEAMFVSSPSAQSWDRVFSVND
jgi:hypothetical protein